jgi:hypothetical protein
MYLLSSQIWELVLPEQQRQTCRGDGLVRGHPDLQLLVGGRCWQDQQVLDRSDRSGNNLILEKQIPLCLGMLIIF